MFVARSAGALAGLLLGLAAASLLAFSGDDGAPERAAPRQLDSEPRGFTQSFVHEFEHGVIAQSVLMISDPIATASGTSLRVASLSTVVHVGQVMLRHLTAFRPFETLATEPVEVVIGPLNTGLGKYFATHLLHGPLDDLDTQKALLASGVDVPSWSIRIALPEGVTWGELSEAHGLEATAFSDNHEDCCN